MISRHHQKDVQQPNVVNKKDEYETKNLDHLGLVAAQFEELGLVEIINKAIPQDMDSRNVSIGHTIKAMVINGLGFANHTLYLMPEFFEDKPVDHLIGEGITANDLNQNLLGRNLDSIYSFDPTKLYTILSSHVVKKLKLPCSSTHIDTTSFHLDGVYNSNKEVKDGVVHITKGYSRDHRPDLNQVGLQLIVENQAGIPLIMQSLNGNESDKTSFKNAINTHVRNLQMELGTEYLIGDSALYTAEGLQLMKDLLWISRVPETLSDAKWVIEETSKDLMSNLDKEAYISICMTYADIQQRWIVYYSPEAYKRSVGSVNRQILKSSNNEQKQLEKLSQQEFACEKDANEASKKLIKKLKVIDINDLEIVKKGRFNKKGRPTKDATPDYYVWKVKGSASTNIENRAAKIRRKSCFILATNQLDDQLLNEEEILHKYKKDQQKVERGFRFLKDPQFLASTLYLKKPERIMALLMIMTLSLLIYATLEHKIRKALRENDETFPNQLGKPIKNPTTRWVFQCFSGIHVLVINKTHGLIMNLKENHYKLLRLLGKKFEAIYSEYCVLV